MCIKNLVGDFETVQKFMIEPALIDRFIGELRNFDIAILGFTEAGFPTQPKSKIIQVGTIKDNRPVGWIFDGGNVKNSAGLVININNETLYGGHTLEELQSIVKLQGCIKGTIL